MGGDGWPDRKQRTREAYYSRIVKSPEEAELTDIQAQVEALEQATSSPPTPPAPTGDAVLPAASEERPSVKPAARSAKAVSTATFATATVPTGGSTASPPSGTPATSTSSPSDASTAWMATPLGFVEHNLSPTIVDPSGSLVPGLPATIQRSLHALATGRGEPVEAVIKQIAEFYIEQEDERAEGPLIDALTHYVTNQLL